MKLSKEYVKNRRAIVKYFRDLANDIAKTKNLDSIEIFNKPNYYKNSCVVNDWKIIGMITRITINRGLTC